ncbi:malto-oligosyltrehalose synthase [Chloroflexia bacterium SDU3-3]|nr:malto-oligosyltrehalose synthase [Chloroflexia bacterium SDU3-3]
MENRPNRIPSATYRVQMNSAFTFAQAQAIVPYLRALGVSDLYASPIFRARPESTHGYDIADHNSLNPALGGEDGFEQLSAALREHDMGLLLDIVPNHMGIGEPSNTWWMDVIENGPSSKYARFFDIDWHPVKRELENKVLLPILGDQYGRVLEQGALQVRYEDGAFWLHYYEHCLPLNPRSYTNILAPQLDALAEQLGDDHADLLEYQSIITALTNLPERTETDQARVAERHREKEIIKRRLDALCTSSQAVREAVARSITMINGAAGDPRSFDALDDLIGRQAYRMAYWRVAAEEINYRRFFDINDLAAIRMEDEEVFQSTHQLLLRLLAEQKITGVRLDHPDGLYDPEGYFRRLQEAFAIAQMGQDAEGIAWAEHERPLYVLVEKILARNEPLPESWPVYGTTGYDFLNAAGGVLVDTSAERRISEIYSDFIGRKIDFEDLVYNTRRQIMRTSLASELTVLAYQLSRVAEHSRYYRDFTLNSLREALREVIASFPVYRTYTVAATDTVSERDQQVIDQALARARRHNLAAEPTIYDFIRDVLLLRYPGMLDEAARESQRQFVMKFQQLTGPVMAKGLEDTAFYIYNRLTSLNEVGGEPRLFGTTVAAFHRQNHERLRTWPLAMLASSTHDTKRSEDVRARISVISELPATWKTLLGRLSRLNQRKKREIDGRPAPDRNEEYLLYQTILGTLPIEPLDEAALRAYTARIKAYMVKAIREAKVNTSWLNPNSEYDDAVQAFVEATLADRRFMAQIRELHQLVAHFGIYNSLSQTLLKLTSPGVPDIYQGTEMFDFSLVDPDNRQPVDYALRTYLLDELTTMDVPAHDLARTISDPRDSRSKLFLVAKVLAFRAAHPQLFQGGSYAALAATGTADEHVVAFARRAEDQMAIAVAPRLLAKKLGEARLPLGADAWGDDMLVLASARAGQLFRNVLTDETVAAVERSGQVGLPLAQVLASFPVALLARDERS